MKKNYAFIIAMVASVTFPAAMHAIQIHLEVDDPSNVTVQVNYEPITLQAGDNALDIELYSPISIAATEDAFLISVVRKSTGVSEYVYNMSSCYLYSMDESAEGETWTITSSKADDLRDGSCTIIVDHADKVLVQRNNYTVAQLQDGENTVKFMTEGELPLAVAPAVWGESLYSVTLNDEPVTASWGVYYVYPAEGDIVKVTSEFPDIDCPIHFTYANEESRGFITSVLVDDVAVTGYNDDNFSVKAGQKVVVNGNINDYQLNEFKVNDMNEYMGDFYSFTATNETTFYIDATKYGMVSATLNIDNPEAVTVYRGYQYAGDVIPVQAGANTIEVSSKSPIVQIAANEGYYFTTITANDVVPDRDYSGAYNVSITEGMVINVETAKINRDKTAVLYVDNVDAASYFSFSPNMGQYMTIVSGYNMFDFYDGDNPFNLSRFIYNYEFGNIYVNGEQVQPEYEGGSVFNLTLADKDVVRAYFAQDPSFHHVAFEVAEAAADKFSVLTDYLRPQPDYAEGLSVLTETRLAIVPAEGVSGLKVSVDEEELNADENGEFVASVKADATVKVSIAGADGISTILTSAPETEIYTLDGRRIGHGALKSGVYVKGGRKLIVK